MITQIEETGALRVGLKKQTRSTRIRRRKMTDPALLERLFALILRCPRRIEDEQKLSSSKKKAMWEIKQFVTDYPDCVNWRDPIAGMVPLLYAYSIQSRPMIRLFTQLDPSKIHEQDGVGRNAFWICSDVGNVRLLYYAEDQMSDNPTDPYEEPLMLHDPLDDLPPGIDKIMEVTRTLRARQEEQKKFREDKELGRLNHNVSQLFPDSENTPE